MLMSLSINFNLNEYKFLKKKKNKDEQNCLFVLNWNDRGHRLCMQWENTINRKRCDEHIQQTCNHWEYTIIKFHQPHISRHTNSFSFSSFMWIVWGISVRLNWKWRKSQKWETEKINKQFTVKNLHNFLFLIK